MATAGKCSESGGLRMSVGISRVTGTQLRLQLQIHPSLRAEACHPGAKPLSITPIDAKDPR